MTSSLPDVSTHQPTPEPNDYIGTAPVTRELLRQARTAARGGDAAILITGGVGAGKTQLARYIHQNSVRSTGPFVVVDCGTLPPLENALFGHQRGAFTGAAHDLSGRLHRARGGILVLDDVERLTERQQDQLHRVVVDGCFYPVGCDRPKYVDLRVVATTNVDLAHAVESGQLKRDFLSRLSYFELRVPALHEREEDTPALARYLLARNCHALRDKGILAIDRELYFLDDSLAAVQALQFVDNVRGLDKLVVRLIANLGDRDGIRPADIQTVATPPRPAGLTWFEEPHSLRRVREDAERDYIARVCRHTGYNMRRAARVLGISPKNLYSKLKRYDIGRG